MKNKLLIIFVILFVGVLYKLALTGNGNFLFNMDNGRDMVDIREMVTLKKPRLIAHTSSIEGVFYGPAWYYLSGIPFIVTSGDPYGSIVLLVILWAIGGFFLLKLVSRFGLFYLLVASSLWIASNIVGLATVYAFNPNPMILLLPLFVYLFDRYIQTGRLYYSILTWFLGGLFFNFQMNLSMFIPFIIISTVFLTKPLFLKSKNFWIGFLFFLLCLMPQILFDLRHQFIMTKSLITYLTTPQIDSPARNLLNRISYVTEQFYNVISPTFMNNKLLTNMMITLSLIVSFKLLKQKKKDLIFLLPLIFILLPLIAFIFIPVGIASWHIGSISSAVIIFNIVVLYQSFKINFLGKLITLILSALIIFSAFLNISDSFKTKPPSQDPSLFRNEIAAIDYVYKYAKGQNFKVYTYLPSVYDYPYQYLFWWYGRKIYGYIPGEYVYSPNKPPYIPSQDKFQGKATNFSGLVFLIKEPDRIKMRQAWENDFKDMKFISKEWVGPLEIEIRKEISKL